MHRRPAPSLIPILTVMLFALTACFGGEAEGTAVQSGEIKISVGVVPIIDTAPLYLGIEKGFFANKKLDVTPVPAAGGAVVVPAVISGQNEFGFSNVVSLLAARDAGLPLVSVAAGSSSTGSTSQDAIAVLVNEDSPLERPKDLEGRRVAINSLNNIGDTTVRSAVEQDGGNPRGVQLVEVPFPQMPDALSKGMVDAAWVSEPFQSQMVVGGARMLFNSLTATYPRVQVAQYFTTEEYSEENPQVVKDFVAALDESLTYAREHPEEVRAILATYTKITPEVAAQVVLPDWPLELDRQSALALGTAARRYGTIQDVPDVDGLFGTKR
jgi:NitT/TauT family transport system substrate-binding protein